MEQEEQKGMNRILKSSQKISQNEQISKNYTGERLTAMLILKQLEDSLAYFDQVLPKEHENYFKRVSQFQIVNPKNYFLNFLTIGSLFAYFKYKRLSPFYFQNYIKEIYNFPLIAFAFYNFIKFIIPDMSNELNNMRNIILTKSLLHSNSVRLTNKLKYDHLDLL